MVQSSDLVRISTVQSMDFLEQSSDLAQRIYFIKSSNGSEEFILLCLGTWSDGVIWTVIAFYTIYLPLDETET